MQLSESGLERVFKDENFALQWLESLRWNGKPTCPRCGHQDHWKTRSRNFKQTARACQKCGLIFTVLTNTSLLNITPTTSYRLYDKITRILNGEITND
jgi:transposase-like protein